MLGALVLTIFFILKELNTGFFDMIGNVMHSINSKIIVTDWNDPRNYIKQFFSGMFITITMTGLDQEMMQKNLSCKNIKEAQKNMFSFSFILVFVNLLFLFLGAILLIYVKTKGITTPTASDDLFSIVSIRHLGPIAGLIFMIGLISAAYPSADGALTSLTTSFCIDFLGLNKKKNLDEKHKIRLRYLVHISFAILLLLVIIAFRAINDGTVVKNLFKIAGYTYGPLLGLYSFGLFTKLKTNDKWVPLVAILSPIICYILSTHSKVWFNGYEFGFELIILNGFLTFMGLLFIHKRSA